jgi:hypothetical protein
MTFEHSTDKIAQELGSRHDHGRTWRNTEINGMANIDEPSGGSVVLRNVTIALDSDIGHAFTVDCCRFVEGLVTEEQLRKKYLLDDAQWRGLAENEELQRLVGAQKERRIYNGEAAREKAAHLFVTAPDVLGGILADNTALPKHRIDAARELRAVASVGPEIAAPDRERFTIHINLGGDHVLHKVIEPEELPDNRPTDD